MSGLDDENNELEYRGEFVLTFNGLAVSVGIWHGQNAVSFTFDSGDVVELADVDPAARTALLRVHSYDQDDPDGAMNDHVAWEGPIGLPRWDGEPQVRVAPPAPMVGDRPTGTRIVDRTEYPPAAVSGVLVYVEKTTWNGGGLSFDVYRVADNACLTDTSEDTYPTPERIAELLATYDEGTTP